MELGWEGAGLRGGWGGALGHRPSAPWGPASSGCPSRLQAPSPQLCTSQRRLHDLSLILTPGLSPFCTPSSSAPGHSHGGPNAVPHPTPVGALGRRLFPTQGVSDRPRRGVTAASTGRVCHSCGCSAVTKTHDSAYPRAPPLCRAGRRLVPVPVQPRPPPSPGCSTFPS